MTRTITWRGVIARVGIASTDERVLSDLKFDRLPVPVYWFAPNVNGLYTKKSSNFQLLGKVASAWLDWESTDTGRVEAKLELFTHILPTCDQTLYPEIDLDPTYTQLLAMCLGIRPIWTDLTPVIVVT